MCVCVFVFFSSIFLFAYARLARNVNAIFKIQVYLSKLFYVLLYETCSLASNHSINTMSKRTEQTLTRKRTKQQSRRRRKKKTYNNNNINAQCMHTYKHCRAHVNWINCKRVQRHQKHRDSGARFVRSPYPTELVCFSIYNIISYVVVTFSVCAMIMHFSFGS